MLPASNRGGGSGGGGGGNSVTLPPPSNHHPAVLEQIQKLDHSVLDEIRKLDPAVVDDDQEFEAVLEKLRKMYLKDDHHPAPSDHPAVLEQIQKLDLSVLDEIRKLDPAVVDDDQEFEAVLKNIRKVYLKEDDHPAPSDHPAVLEQIQKLDHSVLDEIRKLDPAMVDDDQEFEAVLKNIRKVYLKEEEEEGNDKSCNESDTKSENERVSEESNSGSSGGGGRGRGGGPKKNENNGGGGSKKYTHPMRAGDCWKYIKNGTCQHGENCKFNHPPLHPRNNNQVSKDKVDNKNVSKDKGKEKQELAEKPGRTDSKNNYRSGGSKHGKAGSLNHTVYNRGEPSVAPLLNFLGLPIRPGEKVCDYYMEHASCMYGTNCRFNHPDPTVAEEPVPPSGYGTGTPASSKVASSSMAAPGSAPTSFNDTPFYEPLRIPPCQGIPFQNTEWTGYQAPPSERSLPLPPPHFMNNPRTETKAYQQYPMQKQVEEFPERPGQPVCSNFLRTGNCKFKSKCKYYHPKAQTAAPPPACELSDKGLPLRLGQIICPQYSREGICNLGPACKFDHPSSRSFSL